MSIIQINSLSDEQQATNILSILPRMNLAFTTLHKTFHKVTRALSSKYGDKYRNEINIIVHNTATALNESKSGFKVARDKLPYKAANNASSRQKGHLISYRRMISLCSLLEQDELIDIYIGGLDSNTGELCTSYILLKESLITLFCKSNPTLVLSPKSSFSPVILKNSEGEEQPKLPYGSGAIVAKVDKINKHLSNFDIKILDKTMDVNLYRVFKGSMNDYGRFFFSSQNIKSHLRMTMTIDNEECCELDYSSNHARIIYEREGYIVDEKFKPYDISDNTLVEAPQNHSPREVYKKGMMCLLNTKGNPERAFYNAWVKEHKDFKGIDNSNEVIQQLKENNKDIAPHIKNYSAGSLQNLDSEILETIMLSLTERGIPFIPYHDSVVVKQTHKEVLHEVMVSSWDKVLGAKNNVVVDVKWG